MMIGILSPMPASDYLAWPKSGDPLRISKTILPEGYVNHNVKDKQHYSHTIEIANGNGKESITEKSSG